jgi:HSP20 family protein
MVLRRWEPFRDVVGIREAMDRYFENGYTRPHGPKVAYWSQGNLRLDAYHTPESLVIKAAIPGVKPQEVDVTVTGNTLTIRGEARSEEEVEERSYLMRERRYGAASRTVTLPRGLKTDEIEATYDEGVLTLTIPKTEDAKPRAIKVNVKKALEDKTAA